MAMQELRKFKFFDLNFDVDKGNLASALKGTCLTAATSGLNNFIFGDGEGSIVFLNKSFEPTIIKAYNISISIVEYVKHSPYLLTVGEDEPGINPLLKVWSISDIDKSKGPRCVRVTRLLPNQKAVPVTAVAVHESNLLACGFQNGSILLFRGEIARDRSSKNKVLKDSGSHAITGLAFRRTALATYLFYTTQNGVYSYDVTTKDKEIKWQLHDEGCRPGCSLMADLPHEAHFVVAVDKGVYCYSADGKGPCYGIAGRKKAIQWSKTFLIIVSKEEEEASPMAISLNREATENDSVTIVDIQNNLIVSSSSLPGVAALLVECGSFYIVTTDYRIHQLLEKDVKSKLSLLFKKNLYDVAIRMAKSQHYDDDALVEIFRQFGDHLNAKGDRAGAIQQYIKTIGKLEPSYIIRKFMDTAHMEQLMMYLEALHRKGFATGDHTTLLLNCYIKLGRATELKDFIMTKGRKVDFDIEIALKVVRGVNAEDALSLAKAHNRHIWVMRILLQDLNRYQEAVKYIAELEFHEAEKCIMNFGGILMEHCPAETVKYLKEAWTKQESKAVEPDPYGLDMYESPRPHDFLHLFLLKSEYMVEFVEHLINAKAERDAQIYNALIEHYLVLWKRSKDAQKMAIELKLMQHLENSNAKYDREHALLLCQMYEFAPGRIFLYEENKMYYQVVEAHIEQKNYKGLLAACRRFGSNEPSIWIHALWSVTKDPDVPAHVLSEILSVIEKERLQPALMSLEALESGTTLGQARRYLTAVLKAEDDSLQMETKMIDEHSANTASMRARMKEMESNPIIFRDSRCCVCKQKLELPTVHFLCQHSYHQHCLQGFAENENECYVCQKNNRSLKEVIESHAKLEDSHEDFHHELQSAKDGFSIVADYFGRGVFKSEIAETLVEPAITSPVAVVPKPRPIEEQRPPSIPKTTAVPYHLPVPPGRFDAEKPIALSLTKTDITPRRSPEPAASSYKNPFDEDEDYDNSKNPFAEEEDKNNPFAAEAAEDNPFAADERNPFADEADENNPFSEDYDSALNPFSE